MIEDVKEDWMGKRDRRLGRRLDLIGDFTRKKDCGQDRKANRIIDIRLDEIFDRIIERKFITLHRKF